MRKIVLLLLALLSLAARLEGGSGEVRGEYVRFSVKAPEGWICDTDADLVMYPKQSPGSARLTFAVTAEPEKNPGEARPDLATDDGRKARVHQRGRRLQATLDTPPEVCVITLTASNDAAFGEAVPAFEYAVASFQLLQD